MNQESAGCWGTILTIVLVGGLFGYFYLDRSDDKAIHYAEHENPIWAVYHGSHRAAKILLRESENWNEYEGSRRMVVPE